jgi:hypothetical protein
LHKIFSAPPGKIGRVFPCKRERSAYNKWNFQRKERNHVLLNNDLDLDDLIFSDSDWRPSER